MSSRTAQKYERTDGGDNEASHTKVRVAAARNCIRQIKSSSVMSVEWIALVENIEQLGRLSQMEAHMPNEKAVENQEGKADGDGTLWDQTAHEETIRVLVEEAKVNLCVRMMNDFKMWDYDEAKRVETLRSVTQHYDCDNAQLERHTHVFEACMGVLLVRALSHVETLQLTDIPLILEHVQMVLSHCRPSQKTYAPKAQERLVLYYFSSVLTYAEELNATEILGRLKELDLILLVNKFLMIENFIPIDTLAVVLEAYGALCDNEDFQTDWESFFPTPDHVDTLLQLDKVAQRVLVHFPDKKPSIRPLLDFLLKLGRRNPS
eukprot:GEMP01020396.1.p1 GENE.GEMP01020396.1~~GEMP01020396.1.p1  ORF type:complete len:320 (+),score=70.75 GEMP01020396.1:38-997(+)